MGLLVAWELWKLVAVGREGFQDIERASIDLDHAFLGPEAEALAEAAREGDLGPLRAKLDALDPGDREVWIRALARYASLKSLDAWCAAAPDDPMPLLTRGAARLAWAMAVRGTSDAAAMVAIEHLEHARASLRAAAALAPDRAAPWAWQIAIAASLDDEGVEALFQEAVRRDPHHLDAHLALADVLGGHALVSFARSAAASAPPGSPLHALIARAHLGTERDLPRAEVVAAFEAFRQDPRGEEQWVAWNLFAAALDHLGDRKHARIAFEAIGDRITPVPWQGYPTPVMAFDEARRRAIR